MFELAEENLQTNPFDHHGIIAAACFDLKIAELIDQSIGVHEKRVVSPGKAVVAMILNGLGFTDRRLYLTSQFFESKPIQALLGENIKASDLNDYTLGHALDEILFGNLCNLEKPSMKRSNESMPSKNKSMPKRSLSTSPIQRFIQRASF